MGAYKRLIFHFYADENYKQKRAIQIHLACLKHYHNIFDEANFFIAVDDINDKKLIQSVEKDLVECGFKNVRFKIVQNDIYREAKTFYNEILLKMDKLDGMTFFGHTKGYTNYDRMPNGATIESLDTWIVGLYYMSLNFIEEAENCMFEQPRFSDMYGSFLSSWENGYGEKFIIYSGTFYWLNCLGIYERQLRHREPILLKDLADAENFPSKIHTLDEFLNEVQYNLSSHLLYVAFQINYYHFMSEMINYFLTEDEVKEFNKFKNNIITTCENQF